MDILFSIFDHLHDGRYIRYRGDIVVKTIQSARLVCSLFNRLASPLLCPVVTVQLDRASLDRADEISRTPFIAEGVRSIDVVLHYRPKELADDMRRYKKQRRKDLRTFIHGCDYFAETWSLGEYDEDDETICKHPLRVYNKAIEHLCAASSAWKDYFNQSDVAAIDESTLRYREILRRGHEEYRRKHEEQYWLIMNGSFVGTLASAISRMRRCGSLDFVDEISETIYLEPSSADPTLMSTNPEELPRLMAAPFNWRTIEKVKGGAELLPAQILSELPIAIHKAGATMSAINLRCFPTINNCSMINLPNCSPAWPELRVACQHLTKFELDRNCHAVRYLNLLPEKEDPINEYFCSVLSGQGIEDVDLNFYAFNLNYTGDADEADGMYDIGTILAAANWPRIQQLRISYVLIHRNGLESFCNRLDGGSMKQFDLNNVKLLGGSWAGVLDILREKLASRCLDGKCRVSFSELKGGEFRKEDMKWTKDRWSFSSIESGDEQKLIFAQAESYVSGDGLLNPLRNKVRV
jgi:hypothetical protein